MKNKLISALIAVQLSAAAGYCASPGETGGQALKLATDSRPAALGEAFCAMADDASALYWNPAGLAQLKRPELLFTHMNRLTDVRFFNLSYAHPLDDNNVIGAGVFSLYVEDTRRDASGNTIGDFMDYNNYLLLAYARRLTPRLSAGVAGKVIYNKLDDYKSGNAAFDISGLYALPGDLSLGVNLQNISTRAKLFQNLETVPFNVKAGVAGLFFKKNLTLAADMNFPADTKPDAAVGAEYRVFEVLALRAGYKYKFQRTRLGGMNGLSAGCGFRHKAYRLDYAFSLYGELGNTTHRITLGLDF